MGIVERKEREKEARRIAILDAAEKIFDTKGFALATMDDIARDAELAKGTVYLYYKSKEELLIGLSIRGLSIMYEMFETYCPPGLTGFDRLLATGEAYWQFARENPFYFHLMNFHDMP